MIRSLDDPCWKCAQNHSRPDWIFWCLTCRHALCWGELVVDTDAYYWPYAHWGVRDLMCGSARALGLRAPEAELVSLVGPQPRKA